MQELGTVCYSTFKWLYVILYEQHTCMHCHVCICQMKEVNHPKYCLNRPYQSKNFTHTLPLCLLSPDQADKPICASVSKRCAQACWAVSIIIPLKQMQSNYTVFSRVTYKQMVQHKTGQSKTIYMYIHVCLPANVSIIGRTRDNACRLIWYMCLRA